MIHGARMVSKRSYISPGDWHIFKDPNNPCMTNVLMSCGDVIDSIAIPLYVSGENIEKRQEQFCTKCLEIARNEPALKEEE